MRTLCLGHAYLGGALINEPTRKGPAVRAFLVESLRTADTIHRAVVGALERCPGQSKREVALAALSELIYEIPQRRVRQTGMPGQAVAALATHIEAAMSGAYPW